MKGKIHKLHQPTIILKKKKGKTIKGELNTLTTRRKPKLSQEEQNTCRSPNVKI